MKEYSFRINGDDYKVGIDSVKDGKAFVTVNGESLEVKIGAASPSQNPSHTEGPVPCPDSKSGATGNRLPDGMGTLSERKVVSPLPGVIVELCVKEGDPVRAGQKVAVLEAMKMENEIQAEFSGTVSAIHVSVSDSVLEGDAIISIQG